MKKRFLRPMSLLLSLTLLFCALGFGFYGVRCAAQDGADETVAVMYLCVSGVHFPYIFGHSWICISNVSNETLTVGNETLAPGEMKSFGLHAGVGMTVNREMSRFSGSTVSALQTPLNRADLEKAGREITDSNWNYYLLFTHNCTHFASAVWAAVTGKKYKTGVFPIVLKNNLPSNELVSVRI